MKATIKDPASEFTPIDLVITIESEKEKQLIKQLFSLNITAPEKLIIQGLIEKCDEQQLVKIMDRIFRLL